MKKSTTLLACAAVLALAACGRTPEGQNVENAYENQADAIENQADALENQADNAVGATEDRLENRADAADANHN